MNTTRAPRPEVARSREQILDAAERLFPQHGLEFTMNDLAKEAELGPATVYRRFASLTELYRAIYDRALDRFGAVFAAIESAEDGWSGVVGFLEGAVELNNRFPIIPAIAREMGRIDPGYRPATSLEQPLGHHVARAKAEGALREDVWPVDLAVTTIALGALTVLPEPSRTATTRRQLQLVLAGLRPDAAAHGMLTAADATEMRDLHDLAHDTYSSTSPPPSQ